MYLCLWSTRAEFDSRFQDFKKFEETLRLVVSPNLVEAEKDENEYQMVLLELKRDEQLISKFERGYRPHQIVESGGLLSETSW